MKALRVSHHPPKFDGHRLWGIGNIMALFCRLILHDHVIKGHVILGAGAIEVSYHPDKFGDHRHCGSGNIKI